MPKNVKTSLVTTDVYKDVPSTSQTIPKTHHLVFKPESEQHWSGSRAALPGSCQSSASWFILGLQRALRTSIFIKLSMTVTSAITLPTSLVSTWFSALYCRCLSSLVRLNSVRSTSCLASRPMAIDEKGQLLTNGKKKPQKLTARTGSVFKMDKDSLLNSNLAFLWNPHFHPWGH